MEKNDKKKRKPRFLTIALIVAAAIVLGVALRYAYVMFIDPMSAFRGQGSSAEPAAVSTPATVELAAEPTATATSEPTPEATPTATPEATPEPTPTEPPTPTPVPTPVPTLDPDFMKNRVNILILGWDESAERNDETSDVYRDENNNFRSDVIMLLTVNFKTDRVDLISIPRDSYATIYRSDGEEYSTTGRWKINAAFAKGGSVGGDGFGFAMTTVSKLFGGIPIDYYAGVNMEGLKAVVDAMGGVDYDVDVRITLNGRVLEKGYQHLDGQQVLDYCRARKGISTDIGRTDRQQRMLFTIFDQLKSRDQLKNFMSIYAGVKDYIYTNLNSEQIAAMVSFAMGIDTDDLHRKTLEGDYISHTAYNGASYYVLYNDKLVELVSKVFGVTIFPDAKHDYAYVMADKLAAEALETASGAQYLTDYTAAYYEELGGAPTFYQETLTMQMQSLIAEINDSAVRKEGDDENLPIDTTKLEPDTAALKELMNSLCLDMGYTRAMLDDDKMPEDVYKALPKK